MYKVRTFSFFLRFSLVALPLLAGDKLSEEEWGGLGGATGAGKEEVDTERGGGVEE